MKRRKKFLLLFFSLFSLLRSDLYQILAWRWSGEGSKRHWEGRCDKKEDPLLLHAPSLPHVIFLLHKTISHAQTLPHALIDQIWFDLGHTKSNQRLDGLRWCYAARKEISSQIAHANPFPNFFVAQKKYSTPKSYQIRRLSW